MPQIEKAVHLRHMITTPRIAPACFLAPNTLGYNFLMCNIVFK
jgi:hypothetical protein